jgi:hypothetical protein
MTQGDDWVTVDVDGKTVFCFDEDDEPCRRLVIAMLIGSRVAQRTQVARAFGIVVLTVDRYLRAYRSGGVRALMPRKRGPKGPRVTGGSRDKVILAAKRAGQSNVAIARKLASSEKAVRLALRRLGYQAPTMQSELPTLGQSNDGMALQDAATPQTTEVASTQRESAPSNEPDVPAQVASTQVGSAASNELDIPAQFTADDDPCHRSIDRLLAIQGLLQDAAPLFEDARGVREVGALLAIPVLSQQGIFVDALEVFHGIGPAFYGLRTTVVCLCLMMVLSLCRPQHVMRREPGELGRLIGLDRSPEVKTLRRKVNDLAAQGKSLQLMEARARRRLASDDGQLWAYVDGHVLVYSGQRQLREHHVTRLRAARPSVIDYWVNQPDGEPLLVITSPPQEGLVRQVPQVIRQLRGLAPGRPLTVINDREGWSPKMFAEIKDMPGVHFLTYRKATANRKLPKLPIHRFSTHQWQSRDRAVSYELADNHVRIPYRDGKTVKWVELRQITRRKKTGKQTHILTDDFDKPAAELAYRMFCRWSQENYFKYGGQHRDLDALVSHRMEPADGSRMVPNPKRKKLKAKIVSLQSMLRQTHEEFGRRRLADGETLDEEAFASHTEAIQHSIARLRKRIDALPSKLALKDTDKGKAMVQPDREHRRMMHVFRICAEGAELALLELLRPHFADWQHEGRDLVRNILHSTGNIRVTQTHLHVEVLPLASPHKTQALDALCEKLTSLETPFPGTNLTMAFSVAPGRGLS